MTKALKSVFTSGRHSGKSIAWNQVISNLIDNDFDAIRAEKVKLPYKEYLEYNTPPLALVLAMQEAGKDSSVIFNTLMGLGNRNVDAENVITSKHQNKAEEIYDYFAKKHTMRRIKNEYVSDYMLALDDLIDNRKRIEKTSVNILVSLPRIYEQNRALERVMKGHKSAPKPNDLHYPAFKGVIKFVEKIELKFGGRTDVWYFFSTPKNYLMRVVVKKGEYGETAWDAIVKAGKLHIDSDASYTYNVRGYDFNVITPTPKMKISIA